MDKENIGLEEKFIDLGMDSIIGVEFIKMINEQFSISLEATDLYNHPTLSFFSAYVYDQYPEQQKSTESFSREKEEGTIIAQTALIQLDEVSLDLSGSGVPGPMVAKGAKGNKV
ncbi:MAG: acyl carrier protein [Bacteroidota bacterium]